MIAEVTGGKLPRRCMPVECRGEAGVTGEEWAEDARDDVGYRPPAGAFLRNVSTRSANTMPALAFPAFPLHLQYIDLPP
jgi:hypothetical protein